MGDTITANIPIGASTEQPGTPPVGTTPATPPDAPQLIAGKFKTEDDLAKATLELIKRQQGEGGLEAYYKNLESQLGKPPEPKPGVQDEPKPPEDTTPPQQAPPTDQVKDVLKDSGLDFDALSQEYMEAEGKLSDDSYKKLEDAGFPKALVDSFINGQVALQAQRDAKLYGVAGGEEGYQAMINWAAVSLTQDERTAYNNALNGDIGTASLAVEGLMARYQRSMGGSGKLLEGAPSTGSMMGYESTAQMRADMSNPKYRTDPAFRRQVEKRVAMTTVF